MENCSDEIRGKEGDSTTEEKWHATQRESNVTAKGVPALSERASAQVFVPVRVRVHACVFPSKRCERSYRLQVTFSAFVHVRAHVRLHHRHHRAKCEHADTLAVHSYSSTSFVAEIIRSSIRSRRVCTAQPSS